jgi:peptidylprolyl isomerase
VSVSRSLLACLAALALVLEGCPMMQPSGSKSASSSPKKKKDKQEYASDVVDMEEIEVGSGPKPREGDTVYVHYVGRLTDGTKFDSSRDREKPFSFTIGEGKVIKGWEEAATEMQVGGRYKLKVPPKLGYGSKGQPPKIGPNETLLFEIEMLEIRDKDKKKRKK